MTESSEYSFPQRDILTDYNNLLSTTSSAKTIEQQLFGYGYSIQQVQKLYDTLYHTLDIYSDGTRLMIPEIPSEDDIRQQDVLNELSIHEDLYGDFDSGIPQD